MRTPGSRDPLDPKPMQRCCWAFALRPGVVASSLLYAAVDLAAMLSTTLLTKHRVEELGVRARRPLVPRPFEPEPEPRPAQPSIVLFFNLGWRFVAHLVGAAAAWKRSGQPPPPAARVRARLHLTC